MVCWQRKAAFHGLSCGALSLMDHGFWSDGFGPLLPHVSFVDFGDLAALESELKTKKFAALFLEPIQGEGGIVLPPAGYLEGAQALCRKYGTLLVMDEVQTGLYRTGTFLCQPAVWPRSRHGDSGQGAERRTRARPAPC